MLLLIDKPKGMTSHDVVDRLRKITGERKIGHAGTLDPNATGLLVIGVGRESTKRLSEISKNTRKTYIAEIYLGEARDSDDVEGKVIRKVNAGEVVISKSGLKSVLEGFVGEQIQVPPIYSAIKIKGKPAYKIARKGGSLILEPRNITIYSIELLEYKSPKLIIKTQVSSGTYIRALARDIGEKLGVGAYLANLRRESIGSYDLTSSIPLESVNESNWKSFGLK